MINCIIIDDELNARNYLQKLINRHFSKKIIILDVCDSVQAGVKAINTHNPDIVFLDIQMPNENGFELFKYFDSVNFEVIYTTAHKDYAIDAIRYSALDYLLKPINFIDLLSAIKRFEQQKSEFIQHEKISLILENLSVDDKEFNKVALPTQYGYKLIKLNSILYCQSDSNYCKVYCIDGQEILLSKSLKYVEEKLANDLFFRTHKSFLVNLNYIIKYDKGDDLKITLTNGVELPVSVRKKEQFLNAILQHK